MTCPDLEFLSAMAEQRIDPRDREGILLHAADCDDCRRTLLVLGADRTMIARPRITIRVRTEARSWMPWAAAAALAVLFAGLLVFGRPRETPTAVLEEARRLSPRTPEGAAEAAIPKTVPPVRPEAAPPGEPERPRVVPASEVPPATPKGTPSTAEPLPVKTAPPAPRKPRVPAAQPPPEAATTTVVATLVGLEGDVFVLGPAGRTRAKSAHSLLPGEGVECVGLRSGALVAFADRTRLELSGDALVRDLAERDLVRGRRVFVEKGVVKAEVARQPESHPMIFATPHGEAKVLGTILRLQVDADPKKGTRLEVEEGKVELRNGAGKTLVVEAGHGAVAGTGIPLAARLTPREEVLLAFDFEDGKKPALITMGTVDRGPGNHLCLAGDPDPGGSCRLMIGDGPGGLFTFQGDEVLTFDYWVDPQASQVNFDLWNRTQGRTHDGLVPKLVLGKWTRVSIRLADVGEPGNRLREGDWVGHLYIQGTGGPPRRFYIDNLLVTRTRILRPRPVETRK